MKDRIFRFSHEEVEILETALKNRIEDLQKIHQSEALSLKTRKAIFVEKKDTETLLLDIANGYRDV